MLILEGLYLGDVRPQRAQLQAQQSVRADSLHSVANYGILQINEFQSEALAGCF